MQPHGYISTRLRATCAALLAYITLQSASIASANPCMTPEGEARSQYDAGLAAFKAGDTAESYSKLKGAYEACPDNTRYRNDYIFAAVLSGHPAEALALTASLDPASLPVYVLESLGRAARDNHQPDLAIHYYDTILATENDIAARVGRDLALMDRGQPSQAQADLIALESAYPDRSDVLEALGLADESVGDNIAALGAAQRLLEINPQHVGALKLRYRVLVRSGAPHLADELTPGKLLSADELGRLRRDELGFEFRWARDDPGSDHARASRLDEVIERMRRAAADSSITPQARNGLRSDLVTALVERGRLREAADEYEHLVADRATIDPYVSAAVVSAYEGLKQPQRAIAIFGHLPSGTIPSYEAEASYVYALLDVGRYQAAIDRADALLSKEPAYYHANSAELRTENPYYARALVLCALVRSYADRLADAQKRLEALLSSAPMNSDARLALAETYNERGWPRAALDTSRLVLQSDPTATSPLGQLFSAQFSAADWPAAQHTLTRMSESLPTDNSTLLRTERDWDLHQMPEVSIDGHLGESYGGPAGVIDSEIGEYVYTAPIDSNYRAYAHLDQTAGEPPQGTTFRYAQGAGLEYHTASWLATGELLAIDHSGPYPQVSVESTPNDYWKIGGSYALRTLDIPIAAVVLGVHADRLALNTGYRENESFDLGTQVVQERYSDSNLRLEWLAYWHERWVSGPTYKLDTRLDIDTSRDTLADTNYFNPKRDLSAVITVQNQWLQFRNGTTSLTHEVDLAIGSYTQQGYGTGAIQLLQYQLVYEPSDRLTLKAGAGVSIRPFDGQRERLDTLIFNVEGRL